ncbi:Flp family type IVb pilin [Pseudoduganella chitinolytica]|uniref:Flp family type IVb pilin n=1 Tax=Pseudoduganella chitinolytica TaxID=34070 RepID=A0ABY8BAH5_9BURK|nr:Flp family type IVb pilin [Pseudoduganella chitinolytica]WEF32008.1 Flp family type IVb pilin [Pseudoduganella chitinolytica]
MTFIKNFLREEDGVTAIEYALIAALIAAVIGVAVKALGSDINKIFQNLKTALTGAAPATT